MKYIVLGDTHGRTVWKDIVAAEDFDCLIFIGDYFDTHEDVSAEQQINNFLDIIEYKKTGGKEVVMLVGNHDYHYMNVGENYSGFQYWAASQITEVLMNNINHLQMCKVIGGIIFSHAGITNTFLSSIGSPRENLETTLNDLFTYKPLAFKFNGTNIYGDDKTQSCIWVRPRSLANDSIDMVQIIGHTTQGEVFVDGNLFFIDTLGTSGEYLKIENGSIDIKKLNSEPNAQASVATDDK